MTAKRAAIVSVLFALCAVYFTVRGDVDRALFDLAISTALAAVYAVLRVAEAIEAAQ